MNIGTRIAKLRTQKGISQTELGELLGTTKQTIYKYETGLVTNIPLDKIERIADVFEVSPAYLMGWDAPQKAPSIPNEAKKIAEDYLTLDYWGKRVVRSVIDEEKARCEDEARFLKETAPPEEEPEVINLFLEPSAAGIPAPVAGRDFEPYEVQPEDPKGAAYAVRIQGDSMEPYFPDGSIVFVNHDILRDGEVGIFCVDGGTVCKQYHKDGGIVYLFSLNRDRADADVVFFPDGNRTLVCQGRVMTRQRFPVPGT